MSAETAVGSSPTMESLSERRFGASAVISISRTFTFTTSGTKARAAYSKRAFLLSRLRSSPATRLENAPPLHSSKA